MAVKRSDAGAAFFRPVYQGKLIAEMSAEGDFPHFVTIQIGAFRPDKAVRGSAPAPVKPLAVQIDPSQIRERPEPPFQEAK